MIAICAYSLAKCGASEVIDVISNHQFALIRREGKWVIIESSEQKRAEGGRESEERYRRLVETAPEVIYNLSAEDGTITLLNPAFERITGWSRAEWLGKPFMPLVHPDDLTLAMETFQHVSRGETTPPYELRILSKSGEYLIGEFTSFPHIEKRKVIGEFGIARDITERKQAEEVLRRSEENFRRSLYESPLGMRIVSADGETLYANRAILDIYGYAGIEELKTTPIKKRYTPESYAEFQIRLEKRRRGEYVPSEYEVSIVRKNGEVRHLQVFRKETFWNGEAQYLVIYEDITERKRMEEVLRESDQQYQTIGETIPYGVWLTDAIGYCTYVSKSFLELVDMTMEQVQEFGWLHLLPPEDVEPTKEHWLHCVQTGEYFEREHRFRTQDGSYRNILAIGRPIKDDTGKIAKWVGLNLDITERKRAEEAVRESKEFVENLITSIQDGISVLDIDGVHIDVNAALCQMTGFSREELIGVGLPHPYWPPEAYEEIETAFQKTLRGEFNDVELTFMRKNGERFPVIVSPSWIKDRQGNVISYFATVKDITERKRAEEEKRRLEERSRKVVEDIFRFIPEGVLVFSRKMELLRQNQAFRELVSGYAGRLGFAEDELENLIIDKIKAGLGDKNIKEIRISRKHETGKQT